MRSTLEYLARRWDIDLHQPSPIVIRYGRNQIVEVFRELGFRRGAEIGTDRGKYAEKLCASNPQLKLYCIDPWVSYSYYHPHVYHEVSQEAVDTCYEESVSRLAPYHCEIIRKTSVEAVKDFKPNSLDFVFIDGNHALPFIADDIAHWSRVVRPGGIVYGHDYLNDVKTAVDQYMDSSRISPWFILHRGGKMIQCWMYVR